MDVYCDAVRTVTDAREAIRSSIRTPGVGRLLESQACSICVDFHKDYASRAIPCDDDVEAKYRGGILLFTVAAMQCGDEYAQREQLCLQGTRGVDAHEALRPERRRKAAAARRKPLKDIPWYVTEHLPRTQERLAAELRALVEHPERLRDVLTADGESALARYV